MSRLVYVVILLALGLYSVLCKATAGEKSYKAGSLKVDMSRGYRIQ